MTFEDQPSIRPPAETAHPALPRGTIRVMAIACGVMVGNIYVCQPLLNEMARSLGVPEHIAGFVAVAAQIGYALGILLVLPLADRADPKRLVRGLTGLTAASLLCAAMAPGIGVLIVAMLVVASATVVPQLLIPLATSFVPQEQRGRVIGTLQTGLILGILLSRTVSGATAAAAHSWRAPFLLAALATAAMFFILPIYMPSAQAPRSRASYPSLLKSLQSMLAHCSLRISAGLGFCVFAAFSAFWATLAFHLATPNFGLGTAATGLFGIWGAPGAILAPLAGRLADRVGAAKVNAAALGFVGLAFLIGGLLGDRSILALVAAVNLLDFGMQSGQVANQTRIFALSGAIRGRVNTVYMVSVFGGGALGSLAGSVAWSATGWPGVCAVSVAFVAAAAVILAISAIGSRPG